MNTPSKHRPAQPLEQRARALYLDAARQLDPATAGRLRAARRTALAEAPATHRAIHWLVPSGACAAIALAALLAWPGVSHQPSPAAPVAASAAANDADNALPPDPEQADPNLYQNLDFYGWLAATDSRTAQR